MKTFKSILIAVVAIVISLLSSSCSPHLTSDDFRALDSRSVTVYLGSTTFDTQRHVDPIDFIHIDNYSEVELIEFETSLSLRTHDMLPSKPCDCHDLYDRETDTMYSQRSYLIKVYKTELNKKKKQHLLAKDTLTVIDQYGVCQERRNIGTYLVDADPIIDLEVLSSK
jgi:hypothetical protein